MAESNARAPAYDVENLEDKIIIRITAPLSKPGEASFLIDKRTFVFVSNPYFLKIKLPQHVYDIPYDQSYDNGKTVYTIQFKKSGKESADTSEDEETTEKYMQQKNFSGVRKQETLESGNITQCYGFANKYSNMFGKLAEAFSEVVNLPDLDHSSLISRRQLRLQDESEKWSDDHYLADTMEIDHLESIFAYEPTWYSFSEKELNDDMKIMIESCKPQQPFELSEIEERISKYQLVDILFSYAYDKRTTEGNLSVESGWTINKICSTLSWLEVFEDLKSVLVACYRRSLVYPLYRNWNLTELIHKDVVKILENGSLQVTKALLEVKEIFEDSDNRYILNTLYINDICWFAHSMANEWFMDLSKNVEEIKVTKYEVNSELPLLEIAARLTMEEEINGSSVKEIADIVDEISKLNLEKGENCSSDLSDSTDSESDTEESDSSQSSDSNN